MYETAVKHFMWGGEHMRKRIIKKNALISLEVKRKKKNKIIEMSFLLVHFFTFSL
jgi:hypothetical protein